MRARYSAEAYTNMLNTCSWQKRVRLEMLAGVWWGIVVSSEIFAYNFFATSEREEHAALTAPQAMLARARLSRAASHP